MGENKRSADWKPLWINLLILAGYSTIATAMSKPFGYGEDNLGFMALMLMLIGIHVVMNILIAIVLVIMRRANIAGIFMLTATAILLIGFSVCVEYQLSDVINKLQYARTAYTKIL